MPLRELEPFTAVCDCPRCGTVGVHRLDELQLAPVGDSPVDKTRRMIMALASPNFPDQPESAVARICLECQYRWTQS